VSIIKSRKDELKGAYNVKNSPLLCEVLSSSEEITLDLATPSKAAASPLQSVKTLRKSRS